MKRNRSLFFLLLILALVLAGMIWWLQETQRSEKPPPRPAGVERAGREEAAIPPPTPLPPPERPQERMAPAPPPGCRLAIIIDDLGYNGQDYHSFLEIGYPLTLAILPSLPYSQRIAREAREQGREVMLHLPLEPREYPGKNPGEGAIFSSMGGEEMRRVLLRDLKSVPGAMGVNNHMGSRLTEERGGMSILLSELKKRNLYFVDSLTTSGTIGLSLAREMGIRAGARDIFLDNWQDRDYIEGQLKMLIKVARKRGTAIGVGHPYPLTAAVLKDSLPRLEREGIRLVPASQVVR